MEQIFVTSYIVLSLVVAIFDLILMHLCRTKPGISAEYLSRVAFFAAIVDISYLISILSRGYFMVSLMSSIYFISIDWILVSLLSYIIYYTNQHEQNGNLTLITLARIYAVIDTFIYLINPFAEIAIRYVPRDTFISHYSYDRLFIYNIHLVFSYLMILIAIIKLLQKEHHTPAQYKAQYAIIILAILLIVFINAIFLYIPSDNILSLLDCSILGYSLALLAAYYGRFYYSSHNMLQSLSMTIFDNVDQAIVLFDYAGLLTMKNQVADQLLPDVDFRYELPVREFTDKCRIPADAESTDKNASIQCFVDQNGHKTPLRCDYHLIEDRRGTCIGHLFVFTDMAGSTDILTGYYNWENFQRIIAEKPEKFGTPSLAVVCDINGLSVINSTYGRETGDQRIAQLSSLMRDKLPNDTFFIRGMDANLIGLCYNLSEPEAVKLLEEIKAASNTSIQYSIAAADSKYNNALDLIYSAYNVIKTKKLLDDKSIHSKSLSSLVKALQECDNDTEAHVKRTQQMGELLGELMGLTDGQKSELRLLCLMHDIGKIGIPLDILNKPGKLSSAEWDVIKTHVEKGYQIALSSPALSGIADMILHHHERWDGQGYPSGLKADEIPRLSRVISVVDAYDAMVSIRPYKRALSPGNAIHELRRCSGTQFDPTVAEKFIQMLLENNYCLYGDKDFSDSPKNPQGAVGDLLKASGSDTPAVPNTYLMGHCRYILDVSNNIISHDDRFEIITGYSCEDTDNGALSQVDLIPEEDRTEYLRIVAEQLARYSNAYMEHRLQKKDGSIIRVFCFGRAFYDSAARAERSEIIVADTSSTYTAQLLANENTQKAQAQRKTWESRYRLDSLTGLLNHAALQNDLELKFMVADSKILFLMADVDHMRLYNEIHGHSGGDEYLILIAQTLRNSLRANELAARIGGDEYAAALCFSPDSSDAQILDRLHQIYDRMSMVLHAASRDNSISMGATIADNENDDFSSLFKRAQKALLESKQNGRNRLTIN